ncbi:MAG: AGE family epimerase/isomerase, partial [Promicromonosporaceae bacterium]|nr:AGE family epimerase/isomerase [Promicromonosporaceae bacterium]
MNTDRDFLLGEARRLLDFGRAAGLPSGGAAYLDDDGRPDPARGVHTWITARTVHSQALGHLLGVPGSREVAELALRGLWSDDASRPALLHDDEHGGWFNAVSAAGEPTAAGSKLAYDHSFVMLAGASATLAGLAGGPELLAEATGVFLERFWDEEYGRPVDTWNRDFTTADPYRGLNSTMHTVEALLTVSSAVRYLRHGGDGGHCCRAEPAEGGPAAVAYRDSETHHRHAPSVPALPTSLGTPCAWIRRA